MRELQSSRPSRPKSMFDKIGDHVDRASFTPGPTADLLQDVDQVAPHRAAIIEAAIYLPECFNPDHVRHVPYAMITKACLNIAGALDREYVSQVSWSKAHPLRLQPSTIVPSDRNIFRMEGSKQRASACVHQSSAAKRKAPVANIMPVNELWPTCSDIVIIEKFFTPSPRINDVTIPLHN